MKKLIAKILDAAKKYNVWDYAWLKITLCSFGILLGAYFSRFFLKYILVIWGIFIISYVWIMYKTFIKYKD
jgi:small multidrug resistance family-3 protein